MSSMTQVSFASQKCSFSRHLEQI